MGLIDTASADDIRALATTTASPVVVVPVYNAPHETVRCLESLLRHTPPQHLILLVDDCGPDRSFFETLASTPIPHDRNVAVFHMPSNQGFIGACNTAFDLAGQHDVVLVNSDVVVGPEWLERLTDAANSANDIGTVSTLTNFGTILSLPKRNKPERALPNGEAVDTVAAKVARGSLKLRPVLPTAVGHCILVTRTALNLVGGFDTSLGLGYGEEVDFSQRLVRIGLKNILADDVFVFHKGESSFTGAAKARQEANEQVINSRYPWYPGWVSWSSNSQYTAFDRAMRVANHQLVPPAIAIDGRCLGHDWSGTQQVTFEVVTAMANARPDVRITLLVADNLKRFTRRRIELLSNVDIETVADIDDDWKRRFDVVYRPYQVSTMWELQWLKRIAARVVVSQLDLIAYHNPSYFASTHAWLSSRELTRLVLASADGITWISEYALADARREAIVPSSTPVKVVYCGTDPVGLGNDVVPKRPVRKIDDAPFVLMMGVSYHHKNRVFALKVIKSLVDKGWNGRLVLAGNTPLVGFSASHEAEVFLKDPSLRGRVIDLGLVSEAERLWLMDNAAVALYPSVNEGFGLVPFENARRGLATLSSRLGSLDEVLPRDIGSIERFDVNGTADRIMSLLSSDEARRVTVDRINERGDQFTWASTAALTWQLIDEVLTSPRNPVDSVWGEAPLPAAVHNDEYLAGIRKNEERRRLYRRFIKGDMVPVLLGLPGSRRRRVAKKLLRR